MSRKHKKTSPEPVRQSPPAPEHIFLPALLLLVSGAAALIYQLLWIKQLSLIVGVDVYAITIAISAFFAGLAIGSVVFGRLADRTQRPLRMYALIEIGVAGLAIAATYSLAHSADLFVRLESRTGLVAWLLPFIQVGAPAVLMGGTVPVLVRAVAATEGQLARVSGWLYGSNTAGAIIGALLPAFLLIPAFGVRGAAFAAAGLNLIAAIGALLMERIRRPPQAQVGASEGRPRSTARLPPARLALTLYAISGGIALGYEVVWSQIVVQWTSTRSAAFAVVLATYLLGWAIGSAAFAKRAASTPQPLALFGSLIALAAVISLVAVMSLGPWLQSAQTSAATFAFEATQRESFAMAARFLLAAGWLVLLPTLLLGAAFPCVLRVVASLPSAGADTGSVIAWNTAGGIAGTMLAGFVLIPLLGLERSLAALAICSCVVGVTAATLSTSIGMLARRVTITCAVLSIVAAIVIRPDHLATLLAQARKGELVFFDPGAGGTVAVIEQKGGGRPFRRLYVDGVSNSGDSMTSLRYMRLQALLPLIIHNGEPRTALVIGLGTGITAGSLLDYPALDARVVAELLPGVVRAASLFAGNREVATHPGVEIRLRDGRRELLRSEQRYDLITLEPPPPSAAGIANLYSTDFYRLAARRLGDRGLLAQWLPLPTQTDADTRSLVRSFIDAFPHASLWTTEFHEMLLVGSAAPIEIDVHRIAQRFSQPGVATALSHVGVSSPQALLATWVTDRAGLERYAADARPVTDDDPRIEYGPWVMPEDFARVLPALLELRTDPPLIGADAAFLADTLAARDRLFRFYAAGLYAYQGDRQRWGGLLRSVLDEEPDNEYYRWVSGLP